MSFASAWVGHFRLSREKNPMKMNGNIMSVVQVASAARHTLTEISMLCYPIGLEGLSMNSHGDKRVQGANS